MQAPNHQNIKPATQEHQTINTTDGVKTHRMCSAQYWSIKPLDLVKQVLVVWCPCYLVLSTTRFSGFDAPGVSHMPQV